MPSSRKTAYGAPQEAKEVVVTMDRRLVYGAGLAVAFVVALGAGLWSARRGAVDAVQQAAPVPAAGPSVPQITEADARATASALGLPTSVTVVETNIEPMAAQPGAVGTSEAARVDPFAEERKRITPVDAVHEALLQDPQTVPLEIADDFVGKAADWEPDVLANFPDPNVSNEDYSPLRYEVFQGPAEGPRLAITDLNEQFTFNFGVIPISEPIEHVFKAFNVGDEDLLISRVYAACGCTATYMGDQVIDPAGFVQPEPLRLRPGESVDFGVQFDPRAEGKPGSQAKYVQIFTNDPTKALFDATDDLTHETRFRIVADPRPGIE